jgi:uncharacterized protein (DUF779 family)
MSAEPSGAAIAYTIAFNQGRPDMATVEASTSEVDDTVQATPAALDVIDSLEAVHGPLMFLQSRGRPDGTAPICLEEGELMLSPHDLWLGDIGGAPFYIDGEQYERWGRPRFLIDVLPGSAEGFSLEGVHGVHFVTRTASS